MTKAIRKIKAPAWAGGGQGGATANSKLLNVWDFLNGILKRFPNNLKSSSVQG